MEIHSRSRCKIERTYDKDSASLTIRYVFLKSAAERLAGVCVSCAKGVCVSFFKQHICSKARGVFRRSPEGRLVVQQIAVDRFKWGMQASHQCDQIRQRTIKAETIPDPRIHDSETLGQKLGYDNSVWWSK